MVRDSAIKHRQGISTRLSLMLAAGLLVMAGTSCRSMPGMQAQQASAAPDGPEVAVLP
jgi:hypothetical protein